MKQYFVMKIVSVLACLLPALPFSLAHASCHKPWYVGEWSCSIDGRPATMKWEQSAACEIKGSFRENTGTDGWSVLRLDNEADAIRGDSLHFTYMPDQTPWFLEATDSQRRSLAGYTTWEGSHYPLSCLMTLKLTNLSSGYCLDTDGRAVTGGEVRMWSCATHPNQIWMMERVDASSYRLINASSKFCLDTDGSRMNGAQVRMWGCANHPNQIWEILGGPSRLPRFYSDSVSKDRYQFKNRASGFCLDTDGSAANGGRVRMWICANHPNQSWFMKSDE